MSSGENLRELTILSSRKRQQQQRNNDHSLGFHQQFESKRSKISQSYGHSVGLDSTLEHVNQQPMEGGGVDSPMDDGPNLSSASGSQVQNVKKQNQLKTTNGYKNMTSSGSSSKSGARKIVIRKFQRRNDPTASNFDTNWSVLEDSVKKIQERESASVTCVELYNMVEHLCQMNYAGEIYTRLQMLIGQFAEAESATLLDNSQNVSSETFLATLNRLWEAFCQQLTLTRSVFLYLDRTYRVQSTSSVSIWDAGLDAFRRHIVERCGICSRTVTGILQLIEKDRRGIQINKQLLKSLIRIFMNLQMYDRAFEREFLKATEQFYREESQQKIQELDLSLYLHHVQKRIAEEEERVHLYLEYGTFSKLIAIVERCFISAYLDTIIAKGVDQLLSEHRLADLALLFRLLSRVREGLPALKIAFADYIKKMGKTMVMDTDRDKTLVSDLMTFKSGLDTVITDCFSSNEKFLHTLKDSFDFFINTRANKIAELIAKFMDSKLRTGNKECSEEELDSVMDRVIILFRFVQGKDIFEAFYKKDLAKRLLLGRSASVDAEKAMLSKLRTECGAGLTQKLEGMFKDMELSKDFCNTFKQYLEANHGSKDVDFGKLEVNVCVLTMGNWPNYPITEVNIPPQLAELGQICAKFYTSKHNGRKLQWQYSLTSGVLKAHFGPGVTKELEVSLFQAMILLLFNDKTQWGYEELVESTKIEKTELMRTLQSLACGKFRVLLKQPKGKEVSEGDQFFVNDAFNDRLYRIRISQVQMRETEQEHQQTEEQIFQDRQYQIDAAVVRIMKTRKKIGHNQLITEVLTQLRFPVKAIDLKKRIESLIEREYMSRDKEDANLYHYVA